MSHGRIREAERHDHDGSSARHRVSENHGVTAEKIGHQSRHRQALGLGQQHLDVERSERFCGSPEIVEGFLSRLRLLSVFPDLVVDG